MNYYENKSPADGNGARPSELGVARLGRAAMCDLRTSLTIEHRSIFC